MEIQRLSFHPNELKAFLMYGWAVSTNDIGQFLVVLALPTLGLLSRQMLTEPRSDDSL